MVDPSVAVVIPPAAAAFVPVPVDAVLAAVFFFGNASTWKAKTNTRTKERSRVHESCIMTMNVQRQVIEYRIELKDERQQEQEQQENR